MSDSAAAPTAPSSPEAQTSSQSFSHEYVKELREENKGWRVKAQQLEKERDEHKAAAEKAFQDAEAKATAAQQAANDKVVRAELKAAALKAGMIDLDGLKLADLSKVKLNEDGSVDGADALFDEMKKAKPYLFGTSSSSTPSTPPSSKPPEAKKATEMTEEEYAAARKQFN